MYVIIYKTRPTDASENDVRTNQLLSNRRFDRFDYSLSPRLVGIKKKKILRHQYGVFVLKNITRIFITECFVNGYRFPQSRSHSGRPLLRAFSASCKQTFVNGEIFRKSYDPEFLRLTIRSWRLAYIHRHIIITITVA